MNSEVDKIKRAVKYRLLCPTVLNRAGLTHSITVDSAVRDALYEELKLDE